MEQQVIEVVEYIDEEDWEGGDDQDEMVVEVLERTVSVGDLLPRHQRPAGDKAAKRAPAPPTPLAFSTWRALLPVREYRMSRVWTEP